MEQHEEMNESDWTSNSQDIDSFAESFIQSIPELSYLRGLPKLGLKLTITRSLLDEADKVLRGAGKQHENKIKAESLPISLLRIGSWQRVSIHGGDLVAKCYFAKKKLVWEFLENGLKSKIEFLWSNILSLKVVMQENQLGILEIELNQPPSFHHEIDPEPRKHTQWKLVSDFTGGQASTLRRHHLEFPPGALDKPLEKLFRSDSRLFQLSQQGYPTLECPYFQNPTVGIDFPLDFGVQVSNSNVNPEHLSQHFQTNQQTMQRSLNHPPMSDEHISNQMPIWNQGINNVRDGLITNPVGGIFTPQVHPALACLQETEMHQPRFQILNELQNMQSSNLRTEFYSGVAGSNLYQEGNPTNNVHPALACMQETEMHQPRFQMLNELPNMQLSDTQTEFYSGVAERYLYQEGNPTNNITDVTADYGENMVDNLVVISNNMSSDAGILIYSGVAESNLYQEGNPTNNITDVSANYGENMVNNLVVMSNNLSSDAGSLIYPQAASWSQFQVTEDNEY